MKQERRRGMGAGKKKKSRWAGIWTALLGALCALVLSVVFYGTMVYQLADDMQTSVQRTQSVTAADGYPARTLSIEGMTLLEEKKETVRMGGAECHIVTRVYAAENGLQATAVSAVPAAYIERLSAEGWQAQFVTGFVLGEEEAVYALRGSEGMLAARSGDAVYMLISAAQEQELYALGSQAKIE